MPQQLANLTVPMSPVARPEINFYAKLLEAISKSTESMTSQQRADAKMTELDADIERGVFDWFTGTGPMNPLNQAALEIASLVGQLANLPSDSKYDAQRQALGYEIQNWQTAFQKAQTEYQGIDSQASNLVSKGGKTTQEDVDAIKAVVALVNAMTQIGSTLANILAR